MAIRLAMLCIEILPIFREFDNLVSSSSVILLQSRFAKVHWEDSLAH